MLDAVDPPPAVLMRADAQLAHPSPTGTQIGMAADLHGEAARRVGHKDVLDEGGAKRGARGEGPVAA